MRVADWTNTLHLCQTSIEIAFHDYHQNTHESISTAGFNVNDPDVAHVLLHLIRIIIDMCPNRLLSTICADCSDIDRTIPMKTIINRLTECETTYSTHFSLDNPLTRELRGCQQGKIYTIQIEKRLDEVDL